MMESESCYFCTRRAYYLLEFSLKLNKFAFEQYRYLQGQYQKIIKRFEEEDSSAFLREQIEWLGRKSNEIDDITKEEADRLIERVSKILEDVVGKVLTKKENLELRDNIREDLKELLTITLENSQDIKLKKELRAKIGEFGKSSISKKDDSSSSNPRILTVDRFNTVTEILGLGYKMEPKEDKESGTYCRIIKCDSPKKEP